MENYISTKLSIKLFIAFSVLFSQLQAKWGRLLLKPLFYQRPSTLASRLTPTYARLTIITSYAFGLHIIPGNDSANRFFVWYDLDKPNVTRRIQGAVQRMSKVKFDQKLQENLIVRNEVFASPSRRILNEQKFMSEIGPGSHFRRKPQIFDLLFEKGNRWRFELTTICDKNWYGISCDVPCEVGPTWSCSVYGNITCHTGWQGDRCQLDIDECATAGACRNGGACYNLEGSFSCTCPKGFYGSRCENDKNECLDHPCVHGEPCKNTLGSFYCNCGSAYTGQRCENDVNECLRDNPCKNGATCVNRFGTFECRCAPFFVGRLCDDRDECAAIAPCQNKATCVNTPGSYRCICESGFTGDHCKEDINECNSTATICEHESECINEYGSFYCNCTPVYTGKLCDLPKLPKAKYYPYFLFYLFGILGPFFAFLIVVIGGGFFSTLLYRKFTPKEKRKKRRENDVKTNTIKKKEWNEELNDPTQTMTWTELDGE